MQDFYDRLFSGKESSEDWRRHLTQADLEDLEVVIEHTRGWKEWTE